MKTTLVSFFFCLTFIGSTMTSVVEELLLMTGHECSLDLGKKDMDLESGSESAENDTEESEKNEEKEEKEKFDEKEIGAARLRQVSRFLEHNLKTKGILQRHLYEEIDLTVPTPPPEIA